MAMEGGTQELQLVRSLLSEANKTVAETIDQLLELTSTAAQRTDGEESSALENHIWYFWTALIQTAGGTPPEKQRKLIEFTSQLGQTLLAIRPLEFCWCMRTEHSGPTIRPSAG